VHPSCTSELILLADASGGRQTGAEQGARRRRRAGVPLDFKAAPACSQSSYQAKALIWSWSLAADSPLYGAPASGAVLEWLPNDSDFLLALASLGYRPDGAQHGVAGGSAGEASGRRARSGRAGKGRNRADAVGSSADPDPNPEHAGATESAAVAEALHGLQRVLRFLTVMCQHAVRPVAQHACRAAHTDGVCTACGAPLAEKGVGRGWERGPCRPCASSNVLYRKYCMLVLWRHAVCAVPVCDQVLGQSRVTRAAVLLGAPQRGAHGTALTAGGLPVRS